MRLDKFLVLMNIGSRSQIKEMAKKGRISVNGESIKNSDYKIDENSDVIIVDGEQIVYLEKIYIMLHKPAGIITATEDKNAKTVLDLIDERTRNDLFPVGRLDKDTEGLLLITNDGDLAHRLLSPKKHVDKVYYAKVDGMVKTEHIEMFAEGFELADGTKVMPSILEILKSDNNKSEIKLTIHEGKFHQVKRMMEAVDCKVTYLKRLSMGPLVLDDNLPLGKYRHLSKEEIIALNKATGII